MEENGNQNTKKLNPQSVNLKLKSKSTLSLSTVEDNGSQNMIAWKSSITTYSRKSNTISNSTKIFKIDSQPKNNHSEINLNLNSTINLNFLKKN